MRRVIGGLRISVFVLGGALVPAGLQGDPLLRDQQLRVLFEDEIFRPGGPRHERVTEIYRQAVEAGKIEAVVQVERHVSQLIDRRLFDPNSLTAFLPEVERLSRKGTSYENNNDVTRPLREQIALWNLGEKERETFYRGLIERRSEEFGLLGGRIRGMHWLRAASLALHEHMDALVPVIEASVAATKQDQYNATLLSYLRGVLLPLAKARQSRDWVGGYLELARNAMNRENGDTQEQELRDLVVGEALMEIVQKNRTDIVGDLTATWKDTKRVALVTHEATDSDRPTVWRTPAGALVVRAIRALGPKTFEQEKWQAWYPKTAGQTEKSLVEAGWLKARPNTR